MWLVGRHAVARKSGVRRPSGTIGTGGTAPDEAAAGGTTGSEGEAAAGGTTGSEGEEAAGGRQRGHR